MRYVLAFGALVSVVWAAIPLVVVRLSPETGQWVYNAYAHAANAMTFGLADAPVFWCGNFIDYGPVEDVTNAVYRVLPAHAVALAGWLGAAWVSLQVVWPRPLRMVSRVLLASLALAWACVVRFDIRWDLPCLILAWSSWILGPPCALVVLGHRARVWLNPPSRTFAMAGLPRSIARG